MKLNLGAKFEEVWSKTECLRLKPALAKLPQNASRTLQTLAPPEHLHNLQIYAGKDTLGALPLLLTAFGFCLPVCLFSVRAEPTMLDCVALQHRRDIQMFMLAPSASDQKIYSTNAQTLACRDRAFSCTQELHFRSSYRKAGPRRKGQGFLFYC